MSDLPPGEWSDLLVGSQWPGIATLETAAGAAASRHTISIAFEQYADTLQSIRTGALASQEGVTADDARDSFAKGGEHARETSSKNATKSTAYTAAGNAVSTLRDDLELIAAEGNSEIREVMASKKPVAAQITEITAVVCKSQAKAGIKAADHSANLFEKINKVLREQGVSVSAQEFAKANGVDLDQAFRAPNEESVRQSVTALYNHLKTAPPAGTSSDSTSDNFSIGQDRPLAPSLSPVRAGDGTSARGQDNFVAPPHATPRASAPSTAETTSAGQDTRVPMTTPVGVSTPPPSVTGGGQSSMPATSLPQSAPNLSAPQTGGPSLASTPSPTNALSPEGFAQNFNTGAQAGGPLSSGAEGLSNTAAHAMQPQAPIHPESMAAPPPAYTAPSAGAPLFETAHAAPAYDAPQAPVAPPADTTQTYVAAPAAQAPVMPSTAAPAAPAGPLPAYGADLRPAAATAPAAPPPMPSAAAPGSAPVHPASGTQLGQPAVVRQAPAAAATAQPPTGITESALASTATGATAGASAAQTQAQQRLQRLLDAVARQEPKLRWAIGDREDGTTVLVTDLASGWIPPHVEIPTGIKILTPRARTRTLEALLGETTLIAVYTPGEYLPPAADAEPVSMSIRARDTHEVDELGWELGQATKWRDGLPRLAHTLAKAASTGTGYLDSEVELLRENLTTVATQVLGDYPDQVDTAKVGNWQLLATIDALLKNEKTTANYHFAWFQALSLALKGEAHP